MIIEILYFLNRKNIGYNFANTGHYWFGHRCKYRHISCSSSLEFDFRARDRPDSNNYYTSRPRYMHNFNNSNFDHKFTRLGDFKENSNF